MFSLGSPVYKKNLLQVDLVSSLSAKNQGLVDQSHDSRHEGTLILEPFLSKAGHAEYFGVQDTERLGSNHTQIFQGSLVLIEFDKLFHKDWYMAGRVNKIIDLSVYFDDSE